MRSGWGAVVDVGGMAAPAGGLVAGCRVDDAGAISTRERLQDKGDLTIFGFVEWAACPAGARGSPGRAAGETRDFWSTGAGAQGAKKSCSEEQLFPPMTRTAKCRSSKARHQPCPTIIAYMFDFVKDYFQGSPPEKQFPLRRSCYTGSGGGSEGSRVPRSGSRRPCP